MLKRTISLLLAVLLVCAALPLSAFAAEEAGEAQGAVAGGSSAQAPEGYVPISGISEKNAARDQAGDPSQLRVLLIQDTLPWSSSANEKVLEELGVQYDKATTSDFIATVDLTQYGVVIFANDQKFSAYENYEEFKGYLERFAQVGGVIVFGACDNGWANGAMTSDLPGGVEKSGKCYTHRNYISDSAHPIVTRELSGGEPLIDDDLVNSYCSHTYFIEGTLPAGSRVILRDSTNQAPTLVEYPLENGRVIASGLTWEFAYDRVGESMQGGYICGAYSRKCLGDLFLYAIRVSNIQTGELNRLEEYRLSANTHHVIVSDLDNGPIPGATVEVAGKSYTTDQKGSAAVDTQGKKAVTVSAPGYQTRQLTYTIQPKAARIFFLHPEDSLKLPYITGLQDMNNEYDFMAQKVYYPEGKDGAVSIQMSAQWQGKDPKEYVLFQQDENGKTIAKEVSGDGAFSISPGKVFKAGYDVQARLYATDGTASREMKTGIVIQKGAAGPVAGNVDGLTSFQLFENTSATLNDKNAGSILPRDWSVSIDALPIEVSQSYDGDDGSYTIKGTVGLAGGKWTKDLLESGEKEDGSEDKDSPWWTFKTELEDAKELYSSREKLLEKYKKQMAESKLSSQVKAKVEALGYFEVKVNAFGDVVKTSGGLIIKGSGSYNLGGTFTLGPVPVYYEVGFGAKFNGKIGLKLTIVDGDMDLGLEGSLSITVPDITLGGGVGVYGVAQAGVEGSGGLEIGIIPDWKGTLKASASVKIKVLFIAEFKWQLGDEWKYQLWPRQKGYSLEQDFQDALENGEVTLEPVSDSYAGKTTRWNGSGPALQEWVMPGTTPRLVWAGEQLLALFQTDMGGQVKLAYSVYNGAVWSQPQLVMEDSAYDLYFDVAAAGSGAWVVWQKSHPALTKSSVVEDLLADTAANSEIYAAQWDAASGSFGEAVRLTHNGELDMLPRTAGYNGTQAAAWVRDPSNSLLGGGTESIIEYALHTGDGWSESSVLATVDGAVSDFAVGFVDGRPEACYLVDGVLHSTARQEPLAGADGSAVDGITYQDGAFYWCCDGVVYTYAGGGIEAVTGEGLAVSSNFRLVSGGREAIVWPVNGEEGGALYASIKQAGGWSQPIRICSNSGASIAFFDAQLGQDGAWYALLDTAAEINGEEKASLVFHRADSLRDVALDYAYASESDQTGSLQPVDIAVVNQGDRAVTQLRVSVAGDGIEKTESMACHIEPGERKAFPFYVDVSSVSSETELTVSVDAGDEYDYSNNTATVTVGRVDACVDLDYYYNEDSVVVAAKVSNKGALPVHASISVIEDDESGIVVDMKDLGAVQDGEDVVYLYTFDTGVIDFQGKSAKNYVFRVDTLEGDYNAINNLDTAIIYDQGYKPAWKNLYTDVPDGSWYYEAVKFVSQEGLMNGTGADRFSPSAKLSRSMVAQILYNKEGRPSTVFNSLFSDVKAGAWYAEAVMWAVRSGVADGYGNGRFGPEDNVTREQLAVMLWRYEGSPEPSSGFLPFADANKASIWAGDALCWATENGILNGKGQGRLDPKGTATRAEAAQVLANYLGNS